MKTLTIALVVIVLLSLFPAASRGEARLAPPKTTAPASSSSGASEVTGEVSELLSEAQKALDAKEWDVAFNLTIVLRIVEREVAQAFLGEEFGKSLSAFLSQPNEHHSDMAAESLKSAVAFLALKSMALREGFHEDDALELKLAGIPSYSWVAEKCVWFSRLPEDTRIASLRMIFLLDRAKAVSYAARFHKDAGTALRMAAVHLLGLSGDKSYEREFSRLARDEREPLELRLEYALSSARLGGAGASVLREHLSSTAAATAYKLRCVEALKALGRAEAELAFAGLLKVDGVDAIVLSSAMEAMAEWGTPELGAHLLRFLSSRDAILKRSAIRAIGTLRAVGMLPEVVAELQNSKSEPVRTAAIRCIADCGVKSYLGTVADLLFDASFAVRLEAGLAVQSLAGKEFGLRRSMAPEDQQKLIHAIRVWWQENEAKLKEQE